MDSLLCPNCDWEAIWDLTQIKNFIKDPHAWDQFKKR